MKKNTLLYLLLAGGAIYFITRMRRNGTNVNIQRGYSLEVPEPDIITEQEYKEKTLLQKAAPVVKKLVTNIIAKRKEKKAAKKVGYFPDTF